MDYSVTVEGMAGLVESIAAAGGDVTPLISAAVKSSLIEVQKNARARAPHRTGTLQRSILPEFSEMQGTVKVNEKYGLYLEEGTEPYTITPRNKKALFWPGAAYPVKVVHHPGLKARPFFKPAIEESQKYITDQFQSVFDTLMRIITERTTK